MTDYILKSRISDLKAAINTIHLINLESCEGANHYCDKCGMRENGSCVVKDAEGALNIIIGKYREAHKLNRTAAQTEVKT